MSKLILVFLVIGVATSFGRHIRHHSGRSGWKTEQIEIDGMQIDVIRKVMPSNNGLVPVNNALYFRKHDPCEPGLRRDVFGICREVWDD